MSAYFPKNQVEGQSGLIILLIIKASYEDLRFIINLFIIYYIIYNSFNPEHFNPLPKSRCKRLALLYRVTAPP